MFEKNVLVIKTCGQGIIGQHDVSRQFWWIDTRNQSIGIVQRLGNVLKQQRHFRLGFEKELIIWESKSESFSTFFMISFGRALKLSSIDTQQNIVRIGVFLIRIMRVIGCDDGHIVFLTPSNQNLIDVFLGNAGSIQIL